MRQVRSCEGVMEGKRGDAKGEMREKGNRKRGERLKAHFLYEKGVGTIRSNSNAPSHFSNLDYLRTERDTTEHRIKSVDFCFMNRLNTMLFCRTVSFRFQVREARII